MKTGDFRTESGEGGIASQRGRPAPRTILAVVQTRKPPRSGTFVMGTGESDDRPGKKSTNGTTGIRGDCRAVAGDNAHCLPKRNQPDGQMGLIRKDSGKR